MQQDARSTCPIRCGRPILPPRHRLSTRRKEIATMSKPEGHADHSVSPVAQTAGEHEDTMVSLPDDSPIILTIRPAPGHPFASLSVCDQERAGKPEVLTEEATWANLEDLAQEWGSFPVLWPLSPVLPAPTSSRRSVWPFWRFPTRRAPMRTTFCLGTACATHPPPSPRGWNRQVSICMKPLSTGRRSVCG